MRVRVLVSWLGASPGSIVEMDEQEAAERLASGEVELVKASPRERRRAMLEAPEVR